MIGKKIRDIFSFTAKKKTILLDLLVMAAVIMVVVLTAYKLYDIYPFGDESIARGDMVQQTIPAGMYYVWDILHGQASPFFTWNSAFGMNISGASSLGALLSPLNLFLYFTSRDNVADFANILMILKMIAIAFSMYFYLRKYNVKRGVYIAGGILYAFGAASLVHFQIMLVMDIAFLLPLLMIGLDRIFEKKGCKFFVVMLALCMMVNVYTGCITLLFLFLSCAFRMFWDVQTRKERRRCTLQIGLSVVIALMFSAVISVPAMICVMTTSRSGDGNFLQTYLSALQSRWGLHEWKTVERMMINIALPATAVVYYLTRGKRSFSANVKRYKSRICVVLLMLVSVAVAGIEALWHGGSRASWPLRFVYIISFVLIDLAVVLCKDNKEKFEEIVSFEKKHLLTLACAVLAAIVSGSLFRSVYEKFCENTVYGELQDGFLCIFLELVFAGVYWNLLKTKRRELLFAVLCVQISCTSVISFATNKDNVTVFSAEHLKAANEVAVDLDTEINDFERIKNTDYKVDHIEYSLVLGKEALSNYWHVIRPEQQENFGKLGYSINWTQCLDTGGTLFSDTLFQNKYYLSQKPMSESLYEHCEDVDDGRDGSLMLFQNKYELPFALQTDVESLDFQGKYQTQNDLFRTVTGSQENLIQDISGSLQQGRCELDIGNEKKILYFYGTNSGDNPVQISVNGTPVIIPSSSSLTNQDYPADFGNGIICLGVFQNQHVSIQLTGNGNMSEFHIGSFDLATFENGIAQVENQNMKIVELKQNNSGLELELDNVTKKNLFLPISWDEGWQCTVNGEKVSELKSIGGMLSIPVENGKNSICLKYSAPGHTTGVILFVVALILSIAFVFVTRKTKLDLDPVADMAGLIAYGIFVMAFVVVMVVLFAIPILYYLRAIFIAS